MSTGPRQKLCAVCGKDWKTMYRIKYKEGADWVFACKLGHFGQWFLTLLEFILFI